MESQWMEFAANRDLVGFLFLLQVVFPFDVSVQALAGLDH